MIPQLEKFIEEHCKCCKNKDSNLCEIKRNINDRLQCIYEEKISTTTNYD